MKIDLGKIMPLYKGSYSASAEYEINDIVEYSSALYWHKSKTPSTGKSPEDEETWVEVVGGGGTSDYEDLTNKPSINGVELVGDKTSEELGIEIPSLDDYALKTDLQDLQSKTITDTAGYFTTDTVEGALEEIGAELSGINTLIGSGVIT